MSSYKKNKMLSQRKNIQTATIRVNLIGRDYNILVGYKWSEKFGEVIVRELNAVGHGALIFTSPRIGGHYFALVSHSLKKAIFTKVVRHDIPDGDEHKNLEEYVRCVEILTANFPPDTGTRPVLIALGGGAISDLVGFVAGTYGRGNGALCVHIPTTLLACVDSTVGGKTGVNVLNLKNQVGVFYQPHLVLVDLSFLNTLDDAEMRSGLAEVIKYAAVCDNTLFRLLEERMEDVLKRDRDLLQRIVVRCCAIKARIVERDERDVSGIRIVLNFGHTIGHAIEAASDFQIRHGEAVAIGMLGVTKIALELGICDTSFYERLNRLIIRAGLPATAKGYGIKVSDVLCAMKSDKKVVGGVNRFVLPLTMSKCSNRNYLRLIQGNWDEVASWQLKQCRYLIRRGVDQNIVNKVVTECLA